MTEAEIHYIVPDAPHHQADVEQIFNAIGAYQAKMPLSIPHEARISQDENDTVTLKLARIAREPKPVYELVEQAANLQKGVESHFSDEDRARLARYFAGIATPGALETE